MIRRHGGRFCYFRYPPLHTGRTDAVRARMDAFLARRGYTIAPVTIDNSEWICARAYDNAAQARREEIAHAYVAYMLAKVAYYDGQSCSAARSVMCCCRTATH